MSVQTDGGRGAYVFLRKHCSSLFIYLFIYLFIVITYTTPQTCHHGHSWPRAVSRERMYLPHAFSFLPLLAQEIFLGMDFNLVSVFTASSAIWIGRGPRFLRIRQQWCAARSESSLDLQIQKLHFPTMRLNKAYEYTFGISFQCHSTRGLEVLSTVHAAVRLICILAVQNKCLLWIANSCLWRINMNHGSIPRRGSHSDTDQFCFLLSFVLNSPLALNFTIILNRLNTRT